MELKRGAVGGMAGVVGRVFRVGKAGLAGWVGGQRVACQRFLQHLAIF